MKSPEEIRSMIERLEAEKQRMEETRQLSDSIYARANIESLKWVLGELGDDDLGPRDHPWFDN